MKKLKVAIVYDRVNKWGGAERVLLSLHKIFPKAPLYTSVYNSKNAEWARSFPKIYTSFLQYFPFAKNNHEFLSMFMPLAFRSFDFSSYDLVVSVTSEFAKCIRTSGKTKHICYCLTPTRYLWSSRDFYFNNPPSKFWFIPSFKTISRPLVNFLKRVDIKAAKNPDILIAISSEVKRRIAKYYKQESDLVFPPVEIPKHKKVISRGKNYYLIVSRLIPYKKVDLAIKAFNKLGKNLYVVGSGTEEESLKKMAKGNIFFLGHVNDKELSMLYLGAKALIMPQIEDFGIVSVEAQAYGVPVIAFNRGGASDTVIDRKTGLLFNRQTVSSLMQAVKKFDKMHFNERILKANAKKFSFKIFKNGIQRSLIRVNILRGRGH